LKATEQDKQRAVTGHEASGTFKIGPENSDAGLGQGGSPEKEPARKKNHPRDRGKLVPAPRRNGELKGGLKTVVDRLTILKKLKAFTPKRRGEQRATEGRTTDGGGARIPGRSL